MKSRSCVLHTHLPRLHVQTFQSLFNSGELCLTFLMLVFLDKSFYNGRSHMTLKASTFEVNSLHAELIYTFQFAKAKIT